MSNTGTKYKILTAQEFNQIKLLSASGLKPKQVQIALQNGRSTGTINRAAKFDTLEEYRKSMTDRLHATNKAKADNSGTKTPDAPVGLVKTDGYIQPRPAATFSNTDMTLRRIASALERMADAWEAKPVKRRLF
jgi:hypothetical protein